MTGQYSYFRAAHKASDLRLCGRSAMSAGKYVRSGCRPGRSRAAGPGANLTPDRAVSRGAALAGIVLTARLLAAIRGLTGQLRPLHAEPVIRWGVGRARMRAVQEPGEGLPSAGCQIHSRRAMGGD